MASRSVWKLQHWPFLFIDGEAQAQEGDVTYLRLQQRLAGVEPRYRLLLCPPRAAFDGKLESTWKSVLKHCKIGTVLKCVLSLHPHVRGVNSRSNILRLSIRLWQDPYEITLVSHVASQPQKCDPWFMRPHPSFSLTKYRWPFSFCFLEHQKTWLEVGLLALPSRLSLILVSIPVLRIT